MSLSHMRDWYEVSNKPSRLIPMEGTRGLAVLLVFFVHLHALFGRYLADRSLAFGVSRFMGLVGNAGVDLFFVISGYLIYGAVIRRRPSYSHFVKRRIERIYPTFLAVFCFYLALSWLFPAANKIHGPLHSAGWYILENLLLIPGIFRVTPIITVAWSLSYEFCFYLSLPLVVLATGAWKWRPGWRAAFFGSIGLFYLASSLFLSQAHVRLVMFVSGILVYEALGSERFRRRLSRRGEVAALLFFLASLVFAYLLDTRQSWFAFVPGWTHGRIQIQGVPGYQGPYKTLFLSISCFWFGAYCFGYGGLMKRVFSWNPLRYLGNMSYSYYLIHGVTLAGVAEVFRRFVSPGPRGPVLYLAVAVLGFGATWISSSLLFLSVEKPFSFSQHPVLQSRVRQRIVNLFSPPRSRELEAPALAAIATDRKEAAIE